MQFSPEKKPEAVDHPPYRINEEGDTVKIAYHPNGNKSSEYTIRDRRMHGPAFNYYEDGTLKNEIIYKEGLQDGRATTYYENGALYRESVFVNGNIEGIQKRYYENGKLMAEVPYKNGELQLGTKEFNQDGKLKEIRPEILLNLEDRSAFDGEFILHMSLSKKQKGTKFYRQTIVERKSYLVDIPVSDGMGKMSWKLRKGGYLMEKLNIVTEYTTILGNPVRLEKTYNLAIENR
jgi:hypothetical protein